jgi:hypothetical protein
MKMFMRLLLLVVVTTPVFAQEMQHPMPKAAPSEAQQTFTEFKALAGEWEGAVTVNPLMPGMKGQPIKPLHVTMRVTSRGNTVTHEFQEAGTPLDPTKYDHPVTMFYVDDDKFSLVHYCDAGNRPHMVARKSADGKQIDFDFVDLSGSNQHGHMAHATFTMVDADHHVEEWTYMMPGDKPMHARMELTRTK